MCAPMFVTKIAIALKIVSPRLPAFDSPSIPVNISVPPSKRDGEASAHLRLVIMRPIHKSKNGTTNMAQPKARLNTEYTVVRRAPCLVKERRVINERVQKNTAATL